MSEQKELFEDILGDFGFRIRWRYQSHWADVDVWQIAGRDIEGVPLFERNGATDGMGMVQEIEAAEMYLTGFIKWDGCAELDQGNHHWCGIHDFKKHADLLQWLWIRSGQLLEGRDVMVYPDWKDASI